MSLPTLTDDRKKALPHNRVTASERIAHWCASHTTVRTGRVQGGS